MNSLIFIVMMQYVVSTKAGMVNHVEGNVSLKATESAVQGIPITTGPGSYAEILLNPGSFLRLGEDSEAVLDNVDLTDIMVRTIAGASIIEVTEIDSNNPITVKTGDLTLELLSSGLYKFEDGKASVLSGKLQVKGSKISYKKGWALLNPVGGIRAIKLTKTDSPTPLDAWSKDRSSVIASANVQTVQTFQNDKSFTWSPTFTMRDSWMWIPRYGIWTYMPGYRIQSPYGYRYRGYTEYMPAENQAVGTAEGSSRTPVSQSQAQPQASSNAPGNAPQVMTPADRSVFFDRKNPVVSDAQ
jgi:hypothetical protein